MGQRHQIFLKVRNPYKSESLGLSGKDKVKAGKIFGRGEFTVIALHHQWLFGRSAVAMLSHLLNVTNPETANRHNNPFGENFYSSGISSINDALNDYINKVMMMFQVITDPKFPRGVGIEGMTFLNTECLEDDGSYIEHWDMRKSFNSGDNNDGITIIDTIERKYCFMNIFTFDGCYEKDSGSVYSIKPLTPVSALEYATAYYPEKEDGEGNKEVASSVKDLEVLTMKEVLKIFPLMKEEVKEAKLSLKKQKI